VTEYNTYLTEEKAIAAAKPLTIREKLLIARVGQPKATHTLETSVRTYELFTYEDFIKALGELDPPNPNSIRRMGKPADKSEPRDVLEVIAELLYYQSITNPVYACKDTMLADIQAIQETFDINNKTEYVLQAYLTEKNEYLKNPLVIPSYKKEGYEVAYINSDGDDYIKLDQVPIAVTMNQAVIDNRQSDMRTLEPSDEERDLEEEC
jgi:hypothetical protein